MTGPALALIFAPVAASQSLARAEIELRASQAALDPHSDGFGLDKDPKAPALLDRHWAAIRRWTEAWLDANGGSAQGRLGAAAEAAEKDLELGADEIGRNVLAVSAREGETGTIFILRRTPRGFRTVWTLSALRRAALRTYPTLAGWMAAKAAYGCRDRHSDCGPLYGGVERLPRQSDGRPRFYIDAGYAGQGATIGGQISIWRWNGRTAKPLFAGTYAFMIDQPYGLSFRKGILHVGVKGEFKTFYAYGEGRQMDWRIAIGPNTVRDLGRRDRVPELAFIDNLIDRISRHRPPPRAAAAADLRLLRRQTEFDGLQGWTLQRRGRLEEVCVAWDPETDIFAFERGPSGLRLLGVREGPRAGCPGKNNS